jgi:hypothetical protein
MPVTIRDGADRHDERDGAEFGVLGAEWGAVGAEHRDDRPGGDVGRELLEARIGKP